MIDVQKVNETKEKILAMITNAGPSFPTRISREAGISPLFIGALLSEMVAEKKVYMSHMKVGSSPLYFVKGQDAALENFVRYLNTKEQEAVMRLKENTLLDDENEDPAIRVALRKIKDFAIPITAREGEKEKLFWKFFTISDDQAQTTLQKRYGSETNEEIQKKPHEEILPEKKVIEREVEEPTISKPPKRKKTDKKENVFAAKVKDFLAAKDIEVIEDLPVKPKEYSAKIRIDTLFGKQEYLLLAKEKKKLTEDDLVLAVHKAQTEKMPTYLLSTGEIDKNAKTYLDQWKNLLKVDKIKL